MSPRHSSPSRPSRSGVDLDALGEVDDRLADPQLEQGDEQAFLAAEVVVERAGRAVRRRRDRLGRRGVEALAGEQIGGRGRAAALAVSARRSSCVRAIPARYIGSPIYVGQDDISLGFVGARAAGPIPIFYATAARSATSFMSCSCCTGATHRCAFRRQLRALHRPPSTKLLATQAIPMIAITLTRLRAPYLCREPVRPGSFDFALELGASHRMFAGSTPRKLVMIVRFVRKGA